MYKEGVADHAWGVGSIDGVHILMDVHITAAGYYSDDEANHHWKWATAFWVSSKGPAGSQDSE